MSTKHPKNEQVKHIYFHMLRHADGKSDATIRQIGKAISRYEAFTRNACFKTFDQRLAVAFKQDLAKQALAAATVHSTIKSVKRFLGWLAMQPGYKSRINLNDIEYLNLTDKAVRAATAARDVPHPTLSMIETVIAAMPHESDIEKRDRALLALGALTAIRVGAIISLKRKHFDERRKLVIQDPLIVNTKFSKRIDSFLLPVSPTIETVFLDWINHLDNELLFGPHDPLFPATQIGQNENREFQANGLSRTHWKSSQPVRTIYSQAFEAVNLPTYGPHSFRHMIVQEMYRRDLSVIGCKAWSQNLGHESAMTTLTSYGKLSLEEQRREIMRGFEDDRA